MKLVINDYEVEITAKHTEFSRGPEQDTMIFLNDISLMASTAALACEELITQPAHEELYNRIRKQIYDVLNEAGLYKPWKIKEVSE